MLALLFASLVDDLWLGVWEAGALFAFVPFLDAGTLFDHSPSGVGAGRRAWPLIDDVDCDDVFNDCALRGLLGEAAGAADSMPSPDGRGGSRE